MPYPEPKIKLLPSHANDAVPGCWRDAKFNAVNDKQQLNCAGRSLQTVVLKLGHVRTDGGFYRCTAEKETDSDSEEQRSLKPSDST